MSKTANRTATANSDTELLEMVQRHDQAWAEWDRLAQADEQDPRIRDLARETIELELQIVAMPAHTAKALAGKKRIIKKTEFVSARGNTGDLGSLVSVILERDAERVAAAR